MGVKRFDELAAYQLSRELRDKLVAATHTPPLSSDRGLCEDLRRSVRSAPANIAEGFGRWQRPDFVRFLRIARASLFETQNHLSDVRAGRLLDGVRLDEYDALARRALGATINLIRSLER